MILKLLKDIISIFKKINYCKKCGRNVETFRMKDKLWVEVVGTSKDYCFRCFLRIGHKKGFSFTLKGKMVAVYHDK